MQKPKNIIVMKVGPHGTMDLKEIIDSKREEEKLNGAHFWGYSGVFCTPKATQEFCKNAGGEVALVLIETKSPYASSIGKITQFSEDGKTFKNFNAPVQLSGAQYSFVAKNLREYDGFSLDDYLVVGGKNDGKQLSQHLKFRVNKCFGTCDKNIKNNEKTRVLIADLIYPYCIWLK